MKKYLFACPKCGAFYGAAGGALERRCECGERLDMMDITYLRWINMSEKEQQEIKKEYCEKMGIAPRQEAKTERKRPRYEAIPESGWVSWLGCCGWLVIGAGAVGAVAMLAGGGLLLAAVVILAAVMGASGFMVLKEAAEDTRRIINEIGFWQERYCEDMAKIKKELAEVKKQLKENCESCEEKREQEE